MQLTILYTDKNTYHKSNTNEKYRNNPNSPYKYEQNTEFQDGNEYSTNLIKIDIH